MKTICIIGLGIISRNHHFGLTNNSNFKLTGTCDISDDAVGRDDYAEWPFYNDYKEMISELRPDYVVIATPPAIHAQTAIDALNMGCSVIIEKPTAVSAGELRGIKDAARKNARYFETAFHWQYGFEVLHAVEALKRYAKIKKISVSINDPYSADGLSIDSDKLGLYGTFLDSGSNAVSLLYRLVDLERFRTTEARYVDAANADLPVYSFHRFENGDGVVAEIEVDWRRHLNKKITRVLLDDGSEMIIDHSAQGVYYDDELIYHSQRFENRLTAHYYNYYNLFEESDERSEESFGIASKITEIWEESSYV